MRVSRPYPKAVSYKTWSTARSYSFSTEGARNAEGRPSLCLPRMVDRYWPPDNTTAQRTVYPLSPPWMMQPCSHAKFGTRRRARLFSQLQKPNKTNSGVESVLFGGTCPLKDGQKTKSPFLFFKVRFLALVVLFSSPPVINFCVPG